MRIGIDARLWNETGVGRYIRNLVENLLKIDEKNEYVLFINSEFSLDFKFRNLRIVETDIRWHTVEEQLQFPKILEKENLDLAHFPYFSVPIFYKGPYVITIHDLIIHHYPTGKASTLPSPVYLLKLLGYQYVIKKAAQKSQKIITVSNATKDEIVKHLQVSEKKIFVIYEGVENGGMLKVQSAKVDLKDQKYFLYVGNAYPHKNLERLIQTYALLVKEFPDIQLVLVGQKNFFYNRLEKKVAAIELTKNVIFTGSVSDEELRWLYQN